MMPIAGERPHPFAALTMRTVLSGRIGFNIPARYSTRATSSF
jgi:hypothetical protein